MLEISTEALAALAAETRPSALREIIVTSPHVHWDDIGGLADVKVKITQPIAYQVHSILPPPKDET